MSYDDVLADRVRALLTGPRIREKPMFGGLAFLLDGHLAVAASSQGGLMVRVDPVEQNRLLAEPGVEPMVMGGRPPMKGWLLVRGDTLVEQSGLQTWVERGIRNAESLPPKT